MSGKLKSKGTTKDKKKRSISGPDRPRILIITGLSGSGKTVALRSVEDLDFYCVDNLPVSLIGDLAQRISETSSDRNIAVGIDIREKELLSSFATVLSVLRREYRTEVLFLEADTEVLVRRFKETRRPHPLGGILEDAIKTERSRLISLRNDADRIIDTSSLSPHQLRHMIASIFSPLGRHHDMNVSLISFGFKFGVPQNIDLLFDVRFLPNPHFVPRLKALTGKDRNVRRYVLQHKETTGFLRKVTDLLKFLVPSYKREGKSYLSIAFGCTGGRHRSPVIVEEIAKAISKDIADIRIIHREIS